ncbi:transcriptional regulator [Bowmanella denitrificans]|uniref:transcriptional regulator n=1 Tax=Bowmanella denitrificans TaxID=366582 RepID=UPI000C9A45CD|nr:transcriptional regulator [Bowmanella denitrificans]
MAELDLVIHAPNRLQICAMLATSAELDFRLIREQLGVTDSVLSKHLKALENAQYIQLRKRNHNGRPRTWIALTRQGQQAFEHHVQALEAIINTAGQAD